MLYQGDDEEIENDAQSLVTYLKPSNIGEHSPENLFTSENKLVPLYFIVIPNKPSLFLSNSLSKNSTHNWIAEPVLY